MGSSASENWELFSGFEIETVATGFSLPANIAFVPNPKVGPKAPVLYINELYGQVKVMLRDETIETYATGLLNYEPDYKLPGTGESGLTGICVEPVTGDLFLSMLYMNDDKIKAKAIRTHSKDGRKMDSYDVILEDVPSIKAAHQIQAVTIGFDGKLYVNFGDGMINPDTAQDDNDLRGKILRLELDGSVPSDNPTPGSPIYAKGVRNPFGAVWRESDKHLYITDNGPHQDDRICKIDAGGNYWWPETQRRDTIFWWHFCQAPTACAFMQNDAFEEEFHDELFVCLFGSAYNRGRTKKGKKIVKLHLTDDATAVKSYDEFATYVGEAAASCCGMAFGPDGLYFTDLHGEAAGLHEQVGNLHRIKQIRD
jgi:aldose sugar dehydrogenase